eukprot:8557487-Pyramimonas_sp.AAC.1
MSKASRVAHKEALEQQLAAAQQQLASTRDVRELAWARRWPRCWRTGEWPNEFSHPTIRPWHAP